MLTLLLHARCQTAVPDTADLMRKSAKAEQENHARLRQYAYREYVVNRDFNKNGKETGRETETWDVIGLEGSTYRRLVIRNDKPLSGKEQRREEQRLQKETERRRKETPEERRKRLVSISYSFAFPYDRVSELYDLQYKGEELPGGRRAYIVEGLPKPDYKPATDDEKEALNYRMKAWLDAAEYAVARIELEVIGDHSRMQKGSFVYQEDQRNDEGVWLPQVLQFDFHYRFFKLIGFRGDHRKTYSGYHKFQVDSRILDVVEK